MKLIDIYNRDIPEYILKFSQVKEMQRLKKVGMNCGCEYTSFDPFKGIDYYSRFEHSFGCALIVHHFTNDPKQAISALLHDIATPAFAHTIDFFYGDYTKQEYTESKTREIISNSKEISLLLDEFHLSYEDINDYHKYPIADNDSPKLSSDRLEYTLGNCLNYGFLTKKEIGEIYSDLCVSVNEYGEEEICFQNMDIADKFAEYSLKCSKIYVCDNDRFIMQYISEIIKRAQEEGIITEPELYIDEDYIISKLLNNSITAEMWNRLMNSTVINASNDYKENSYKVNAKKRYIDPYICGVGRLTSNNEKYKQKVQEFLGFSFDYFIFIE